MGDLVAFGALHTITWSDGQTPEPFGLAVAAGPDLPLQWGSLAIVDPAWSGRLPTEPHSLLGGHVHTTVLSLLVPPPGSSSAPFAVAAVLGRPDHVSAWHPLAVAEQHFHLDVDSGLGAFVDSTSIDALRQLTDDSDRQLALLRDTPHGRLVPVEADGRVVAVVFRLPEGAGLYPTYIGYDSDSGAVAILVDFRTLRVSDGPVDTTPVPAPPVPAPPPTPTPAAPDLLLTADEAVVWPASRGTLRRVDGPVLRVEPGEALLWADLLDGRPQVETAIVAGAHPTRATAVEWRADDPAGPAGAALCVGDPEAVVHWTEVGELGVDRGVGWVAPSSAAPAVTALLDDVEAAIELTTTTYAAVLRPVDVDGEVVGVAFHCGMGASTARLLAGVDREGRTVALLADLEVLDGAEIVARRPR